MGIMVNHHFFHQQGSPFDFKTSYDEEHESKFLKKSKENPFIPAGE
jgi:hypothetical protein